VRTTSLETVWNDIQVLSDDDQHELLERLLDRFESLDEAPETDPEFDAELLRRAAEFDADPSIGIPWEQVREMR
jgi:putative addiction module component (TIGR02574 family)